VLFHIHSLSAVIMVAVYIAAFPLWRWQPQRWLRIGTAGTISGLLVLPWAVWSGWLSQTTWIPAARHSLDLSMLLRSLPSADPAVLTTAGLGLAWFGVATLLSDHISDRWRRPFVEQSAAFYFALIWLVLAYAIFVAFIPAASYFIDRLKLVVAVPGLLFITLVITAVSRALQPTARYLPVIGMVVFLVLAGQLPLRVVLGDTDDAARHFADLIGLVRSWTLGAGGRIFASPNDHLVLTYYSGRPVQSIAPIRKEWLDRFPGDMVIMEGKRFITPAPAEVQDTARGLGHALTPAEAKSRALAAPRLATALRLQESGVFVMPPGEQMDALDHAVVTLVQENTRRQVLHQWLRGTPLGQVATPSDFWEYRHSFFYWFADPIWRSGPGLNYSACRATAYVHLHPSGFTVFDCRSIRTSWLVPHEAHSRKE
jgi:hypothetical protein